MRDVVPQTLAIAFPARPVERCTRFSKTRREKKKSVHDCGRNGFKWDGQNRVARLRGVPDVSQLIRNGDTSPFGYDATRSPIESGTPCIKGPFVHDAELEERSKQRQCLCGTPRVEQVRSMGAGEACSHEMKTTGQHSKWCEACKVSRWFFSGTQPIDDCGAVTYRKR